MKFGLTLTLLFSLFSAQAQTQCNLFYSSDTTVNVFISDSINLPTAALIDESFFSPDPMPNFQTYLPDANHQTYSLSMEISHTQGVFTQGDLLNFCFDIEHSNLGDLEIELICPNGNSSVLINAYSGTLEAIVGGFSGDGCFLGGANAAGNSVGVCGSYCFSQDSVLYSPFSDGYNLVSANGPSNGQMVEQVFKSSEDGFSNLYGCPYQGTWMLEVTDNQLDNDGWICDIDFLTVKYPNLMFEWIPNIGLSNNMIRSPLFYSDTTIQYQLIVTDGYCNDTINYKVEVENLSVEENEIFNCDVYPNPVAEKLTIRFSRYGNFSVSVYNLLGQKMEQFTTHSSLLTFDLVNYLDGSYIVEVFDLVTYQKESKKIEVLK